MKSDEDQIRELVTTWITASLKGDIDTVLDLMTDDVIFLVPGRAPMRKDEFASAAKVQPGKSAPTIDGRSDIQEIKVLGDWAFIRTKLTVVATPPGGGQAVTRAGHTLSILKREHGKWVLARDANLLSQVPSTGDDAQ